MSNFGMHQPERKTMVPIAPAAPTASSATAPIDTMIRAKSSFAVRYPDFVRGLLRPEMWVSNIVPDDYDLAELSHWQYEGQCKTGMSPRAIHDVVSKRLMNACLMFRDGIAIQAKGLPTYRHVFGDKKAVLWGEVMLAADHSPIVAYLVGNDEKQRVEVHWVFIDPPLGERPMMWDGGFIAPRFRSRAQRVPRTA